MASTNHSIMEVLLKHERGGHNHLVSSIKKMELVINKTDNRTRLNNDKFKVRYFNGCEDINLQVHVILKI